MKFLLTEETNLIYLSLAAVFILLNAFFVAAEFAIVKVRATRLEVLATKGNHLAKLALKMVSNLDPFLSATQLGITLASLGLGWVGEPAFAHLMAHVFEHFQIDIQPTTLHSLSLTTAFLIISSLHIILGELVPKSMAIQAADKITMLTAVPLYFFYIVFFPLLWVLNKLSSMVLILIRFKGFSEGGRAPSEAELKLIFDDSFEDGTISGGKKDLLHNAIEFSHKKAFEIMVPEKDIICFYLTDNLVTNLNRAKESGHSRFPVRENPKGKILGFVHMKDVIWSLENDDVINVFDLVRPALFFNPHITVEQALKIFQRKKIHLAIVENPPGKILGLITLEDVIEELVGDIDDEFDVE